MKLGTKQDLLVGAKLRALRRREGLSQASLAERLDISPSYLNLIENNRRSLPAALLLRLAQLFDLDLKSFAGDEDARTISELLEVFSDPLFEGGDLTSVDVREIATGNPNIARAVLSLYRAYQTARSRSDELVSQLSEGQDKGVSAGAHLPNEEVSDFIQRKRNYFPAFEDAAKDLLTRVKGELAPGLTHHLEKDLGVEVRLARWGDAAGILRRFDPEARVLHLSELLPTRSRSFQLAHQIALLSQRDLLDEVARDPCFTSEDSRALVRVALANYFAAAVLMPYERFLQAAREERFDIDVLGRRFRVGFEQVCHRLTTLRRPGHEGIPFHMIRIDVAGNISKRFSASGIRFARFSGACSRWNIFAAFQTPGMIRVQVSRMPEGASYVCIARTIQKDAGGYHAQQPVMAIGLGCELSHAKDLVYADAVNLEDPRLYVPVGVTCRTCERTDCGERALPSLKVPLRVDENRRGMTLYMSTKQS
ncbi:MAG: short-chain fatty acyl-CoA regulator family protein [Polyangiaceae bacterium]